MDGHYVLQSGHVAKAGVVLLRRPQQQPKARRKQQQSKRARLARARACTKRTGLGRFHFQAE